MQTNPAACQNILVRGCISVAPRGMMRAPNPQMGFIVRGYLHALTLYATPNGVVTESDASVFYRDGTSNEVQRATVQIVACAKIGRSAGARERRLYLILFSHKLCLSSIAICHINIRIFAEYSNMYYSYDKHPPMNI